MFAEDALALAKRGFAVFPLKARDKAPATRRGFKDATADVSRIEAWWQGWPEQNIGIATGEVSGIWVLDIDREKGGEGTLARLIAEHGELPPTVESITGNGRHFYFRWTKGIGSTAERLGPGLDTRGNGGYVVAPPSVHPSGRSYAWSTECGDEFADAPEWLVGLVQSPPKANGANGHAHPPLTSADRTTILGRLPQRLRALIDTEAEKGERSDHCYHVMQCLFERGLSDFDVHLIADGAPFARKFWERGDLLDEIGRTRGKWDQAGGQRVKSRSGADWRTVVVTAADLKRQTYPPVSWIVPALIPEGLALIAGRPKIGKSWLALDLALGVAGGTHVMGGIMPAHGDVLYCALEDNPRRLQRRIAKLISPIPGQWPERLTLATSWRRLDQGGVDDIAAWCNTVAMPKLVILDTLAGCRPIRTNNGYAEDYEALAAVHRLSSDRGIGVLALHHVRKMEAEDPIDQVSGTLGLSGAADTVMVLNRSGQGTTLYGRGRDLEEFDRAVEFSRETCKWRLLGNAEEVRRSDTCKAILGTMVDLGETAKPKEIAARAGLDVNTVTVALSRMVKDGLVAKDGYAKYRLPGPTA